MDSDRRPLLALVVQAWSSSVTNFYWHFTAILWTFYRLLCLLF